jgi:hypothetical protein
MVEKLCISGTNCKHPDGPLLPLSEFYKHRPAADGLFPYCKECKKVLTRQQNAHCKNESTNIGEKLVIERLRSLGIYAVPGKSSEWFWIDVVAWGCVRIEVKYAREHNGAFKFSIGHKDGLEKERSDIIVLVCLDNTYTTYHVFKSDHSVFYHKDGIAKQGVVYTPFAKFKHTDCLTLDNNLMLAHQEQWNLIEEHRTAVSKQLQESINKH